MNKGYAQSLLSMAEGAARDLAGIDSARAPAELTRALIKVQSLRLSLNRFIERDKERSTGEGRVKSTRPSRRLRAPGV